MCLEFAERKLSTFARNFLTLRWPFCNNEWTRCGKGMLLLINEEVSNVWLE